MKILSFGAGMQSTALALMSCENAMVKGDVPYPLVMSQEQINISHMQCWLFRLAQTKWNQSPEETTEIFRRYDLFDYISECYDVLHLSSYQHAPEEVEALLAAKEVKVC